MSTGYGWEGIREVCATLLVRAMYVSASAQSAVEVSRGAVTSARPFNVCKRLQCEYLAEYF